MKANDKSTSDSSLDFNVVAFYALLPAPPGSLERFYDAMLAWFHSFGVRPSHSRLTENSGEHVSRHEGFRNLACIELDVRDWNPGWENQPLCKYLRVSHSDCFYAAFPAHIPMNSFLAGVFPSLLDAMRPAYGIGFTRAQNLGPIEYALGSVPETGPLAFPKDPAGVVRKKCYPTGTPEHEAEEKRNAILNWAKVGMHNAVFRDGFLREVYPWNFLTAYQLVSGVESETLESWITRDPVRGQLTDLGFATKLWTVEPSQKDEIRKALWEAGVIFNWRTYSPSAFALKPKREFLAAAQAGADVDALLALFRRQRETLTGGRYSLSLGYIADLWRDRKQFDPAVAEKIDAIKGMIDADMLLQAELSGMLDPTPEERARMLRENPPIPGTPVLEIGKSKRE